MKHFVRLLGFAWVIWALLGVQAIAGDVDKNGVADLVFRDDASGTLKIIKLGRDIIPGAGTEPLFLRIGETFKPAGTAEPGMVLEATPMFDSDGSDLFYRSADGKSAVFWKLTAGSISKTEPYRFPYSGTLDENRYGVGAVDLLGDGMDEIVFRSWTTGKLMAWSLKYNAAWEIGYEVKDLSWEPVGFGALVPGAIPSVFWQNKNAPGAKQIYIWDVQGDFVNVVPYRTWDVPEGYRIVMVGDFTNDGAADYLLANSADQLWVIELWDGQYIASHMIWDTSTGQLLQYKIPTGYRLVK